MSELHLTIRKVYPEDYKVTEVVTREAFWNHHGPGCSEHFLLHVLRQTEAYIPELDYLVEIDGKCVGHIVYSHSKVTSDFGQDYPVITFGPVSVLPEFQGMGIGMAIIEHTLEEASLMGYKAVFIYGDPSYYEKFGFVPAEKFSIGTPDHHYAEALMAFPLEKDALKPIGGGTFYENSVFEVSETDVELFDQPFTVKEKRSGLSSQKRFSEIVKMRKPR